MFKFLKRAKAQKESPKKKEPATETQTPPQGVPFGMTLPVIAFLAGNQQAAYDWFNDEE